MKELVKTNIYDCKEEIIIAGSCLKSMEPLAYEKLGNMNMPIFNLCLEESHINMAITKILGMVRAKDIRRIIFASVDKSPHCVQLHYIQDEITKLGFNVECINYIARNSELVLISKEAIKLSKNLFELNNKVSI